MRRGIALARGRVEGPTEVIWKAHSTGSGSVFCCWTKYSSIWKAVPSRALSAIEPRYQAIIFIIRVAEIAEQVDVRKEGGKRTGFAPLHVRSRAITGHRPSKDPGSIDPINRRSSAVSLVCAASLGPGMRCQYAG